METSVTVADGFDADALDPTASPLRGTTLNFKDAEYYAFGDKLDVRERRFVVLDRCSGWQKLAKECPPEYLIWKTGEPKPPQPHVEEKDWPLNLNGAPEHPWKWTHYL